MRLLDLPAKRRDLLLLLLMLGAILVFFAPVLLSGKVINPNGFLYIWPPFGTYAEGNQLPYNSIASDFADAMFPSLYMARDAILNHGDYPISNRFTLCLENAATMFAANWVSLDFVLMLIFGPAWGITLAVIVRFFLGAALTYLFLRYFLRTRSAAAFGATVFCFSVFDIIHAWLPYLFNFPLLLFASERLIRKRTFGATLLMLLAYFSTLAAGQVVWSIHLILFQIVYVLFRTLLPLREDAPPERLKLCGYFVFSGAAALLLFTHYILPSSEHQAFLSLSYRSEASLNFHPHVFSWMFLFPRIAGELLGPLRWGGNVVEYSFYLGVAPLLLFAIAPLVLRRRIAWFFVLASVAIYLIITDSFGLMHFVRKLPFFDNSSNTRLRFLWALTVPISAAFVLDGLLSELKRRQKVSIIAFVAFALAAVLIGLKLVNFDLGKPLDLSDPVLRSHLIEQLCLLAASIGAVVLMLSVRQKQLVAGFLVLLTFGDLYHNLGNYLPLIEAKYALPKVRAIDFLQNNLKHDGRILPIERSFISHFQMAYGIPSIGVRGFYTDRQKEFYRLIDPGAFEIKPTAYYFSEKQTNYNSPIIDLLNVQYLVMARGYVDQEVIRRLAPRWQVVYDDEFFVFENHGTPQPGFLVEKAEYLSSQQEVFERLKSINPTQVALLEDPLIAQTLTNAQASLTALSTTENQNSSALEYNDNDLYRFKLTSAKPGVFIFSKFFHPAWKARLDGVEVGTFIVDGTLIGVAIAAGAHTLELEFMPKNFRLGLLISALTFLVLIVIYSVAALRAQNGKTI